MSDVVAKPAGVRAGFSAPVAAGEVLHLWQKALDPAASSSVVVRSADGGAQRMGAPPSDDFLLTELVLAGSGEIDVEWDSDATIVSVCYAFHPGRVIDEGIRVLWTSERARANAKRYRLHLAPPFGWMNDPNGSIEAGGKVHVFYQHYPHARHWHTMHWGHSVSENLVDWRHLPVFLHPREAMLVDPSKSGGAFSGSAIKRREGGLRIFYTDREDGRSEPEWQMTSVSPDTIRAAPSTPVIDRPPPLPGFGRDLRDPFVFAKPGGGWSMLLGGADTSAALVLLYETDAPDAAEGWRFVAVLHREPLERVVPAECPCLVPLDGEGDGLHALVFGLIGHRQLVKGRRNPSFALVGRFDGVRFDERTRRELDFIGDCYAFQSFVCGSGPVGIAWAANWADVRRKHDYASSMTFPRRLIWRDGRLHMPPIDALSLLRRRRLAAGAAALACRLATPDGLAEIDLSGARRGAPFRIAFSHPQGEMALVYDGVNLEFVGPSTAGAPRAAIDNLSPRDVRIFVDVGIIEVFVDDGLWCGTKRIDADEPVDTIFIDAAPDAFSRVEVWCLRPQAGA